MRLLIVFLGVIWVSPAMALKAKEGGELGNAFLPFANEVIGFSVEYPRLWRYNDLSQAVSFADDKEAKSFFSVAKECSAPATPVELLAMLKAKHPSVDFSPVSAAGLSGFEGTVSGTHMAYLLRGHRELLVLKMRSSDGDRSDQVLQHMLETLKIE